LEQDLNGMKEGARKRKRHMQSPWDRKAFVLLERQEDSSES
jgi:hypothetical protein